jgi:hypothetical protein
MVKRRRGATEDTMPELQVRPHGPDLVAEGSERPDPPDGPILPDPGWRDLEPRQQAFLTHFLRVGTIRGASLASGVARSTHHWWIERDTTYAVAFGQARDALVETLEAEAVRRARDGWVEPVFHQGAQVGSVRKYSDTLIIFLLKANRPDKYRDNVTVIKLGDVNLKSLTDDQLRVLRNAGD